MNLGKFLAQQKVLISMSEYRRLVAMRAVVVNGVVETDSLRELKEGDEVRVAGKSLTFTEAQ